MFKNLIGVLRIALCDDMKAEMMKTENYLRTILAHPQFEKIEYSIECYDNGIDFLNSKEDYDLVFLDVKMPGGIDGFDTARKLKERRKKPLVIFLTNHEALAPNAFSVGGFRYLSKDFDEEKCTEALVQAIKTIHSNQMVTVQFKDSYGEELLEEHLYLNEITHIDADGKNSFVYTKTKKYPSNKPLKYWWELLPKDRFFKAHKSHIIHFINVIDIDLKDRLVQLDSDIIRDGKIEVSKRQVQEAYEAMHVFFRNQGR
ncbi:MAG: response regulator transcription factor [Turicibacter sp.]|nr:response regulator transcription factor [Turicibacter sp.]